MAHLDVDILEAVQLKRPLHSLNVVHHVQSAVPQPLYWPRQLLYAVVLIYLNNWEDSTSNKETRHVLDC